MNFILDDLKEIRDVLVTGAEGRMIRAAKTRVENLMVTIAEQQQKEDDWKSKIAQLADDELIIYACKKCNSPVSRGHCCIFCGDTNPSEKP